MSTNDWRHKAACREVDPELFFPVGESERYGSQTEEAKAICRTCPVMQQCREWALATNQEAGVWGGLSEKERRSIRRRAQRQAPRTRQVPAKCGTRGGYKRHQREKTRICDRCRAANSAYGAELYHRNNSDKAA